MSELRLRYSCHLRSYKDFILSYHQVISRSSRDTRNRRWFLDFFQGWYLNGSRPATACDVSEHVHVAGTSAQVGLETSRLHPPLKATRLHAIDSWRTYFHSWEVRYRADEPHGSTWYLEQSNAFLAMKKRERERED